MNQTTEKVISECLPKIVEQLHNTALNLKALAVMFHSSLESKIEQVDFNSLPDDVQKAVLSQINPETVQTGVINEAECSGEPGPGGEGTADSAPEPTPTTGVNYEESVHDKVNVGASAQ